MSVSREVPYRRFEAGKLEPATGQVVAEALVRLHVNGSELVMLMCTPHQLDWLALGFLCSEGIIAGLQDVRRVVVCPSRACVEVWLHDAERAMPKARVITSGCGGGITFSDLTTGITPLASRLTVTPRQLGRLMFRMQEAQQTRGVHTAGLGEGEEVLATVEDVGRHNAIDKLWGRCLAEGIDPAERILLCTGRISSEMLTKAARMGVPVVVSRTSPTTLSLALAEAWNLTLVGYTRRDSLNVYTGVDRIVMDE